MKPEMTKEALERALAGALGETEHLRNADRALAVARMVAEHFADEPTTARRTVYVQACSGFDTAEKAIEKLASRCGFPTLEQATDHPCEACKQHHDYTITLIIAPVDSTRNSQ